MSAIHSPNPRALPSEDVSNPRRGIAYVLWELWAHLPIWAAALNIVLISVMAMALFNPPRVLYLATAAFPLFWLSLYVYARYATDPKLRTRPPAPTLRVLAPIVFLVVAAALLVRPVWDGNVVTPISQIYPGAQVDQTAVIKDAQGRPLLDARGQPLIKNRMMTAPGGHPYKVEGKLLIDLTKKKPLATYWEVMNVLTTALLFIHCLYFRGWVGLLKFFGAALLYGFLLESGGVSHDFFREMDYNVYLPFFAAPVATMAGWSIVFYSSIFTYEMIERGWPWLRSINPLITGLIISLIALFRDLQLDPVATGLALWTWHELLPPWYLGVPLVNFTSWLCAVFAFGVGYTFIDRRHWGPRAKIAAMFAMIPLLLIVAPVLNFNLCTLIGGPRGPVWEVLHLPRR